MSRSPELISLATLLGKIMKPLVLLHPDPPLGKEEINLFATLWEDLQIRSLSQWLAEEVS